MVRTSCFGVVRLKDCNDAAHNEDFSVMLNRMVKLNNLDGKVGIVVI